ncbi:hypothetical protein EVAR_90460_1 [Eumeta japonica]|uniref:Uncharacterized protein n=1 Tax=Eumeta variegata TaxID=151549 RepID=A0A4C1SIE9_EUMVA|nr:hypothetical protein EVAR_90460_1 [Eumeta japonica]
MSSRRVVGRHCPNPRETRLKTPDGREPRRRYRVGQDEGRSERIGLLTISPPKLLVEVEPMDKIAALGKETDAGVLQRYRPSDFARRASLREEIGRPSLSGVGDRGRGPVGELRGASPGVHACGCPPDKQGGIRDRQPRRGGEERARKSQKIAERLKNRLS